MKSLQNSQTKLRRLFTTAFADLGEAQKKKVDAETLFMASLPSGTLAAVGLTQKAPWETQDTVAMLYLDFPKSRFKPGFYLVQLIIEDQSLISYGLITPVKGKKSYKAVVNQSPPLPDPGTNKNYTIESIHRIDDNHLQVDGKVKLGDKWRHYDLILLM
ncbi:MAG: hypothetical protein H6581_16675 [Bacteroidia bacterium]|nr:hypothetical protein [Bacteroidia bacterium]